MVDEPREVQMNDGSPCLRLRRKLRRAEEELEILDHGGLARLGLACRCHNIRRVAGQTNSALSVVQE